MNRVLHCRRDTLQGRLLGRVTQIIITHKEKSCVVTHLNCVKSTALDYSYSSQHDTAVSCLLGETLRLVSLYKYHYLQMIKGKMRDFSLHGHWCLQCIAKHHFIALKLGSPMLQNNWSSDDCITSIFFNASPSLIGNWLFCYWLFHN